MDEVMNDTYARAGDYVNGHYAYTDPPGVLRQYLKFFYMVHGTKYVLLAGSDIPYRELNKYYDYKWRRFHGDLYYSALNGDWKDSTKIETSPDLYVGRLLGTTPDQFEAYSDKLFRYELNPGKGDYNYLTKALYTIGKDFSGGFFNNFIQSIGGIFPTQIDLTEKNNNNTPTGCDVLDSINYYRPSFMYSLNHGAASAIRTYGKDSYNRRHFLWAIDTVKVLFDIIDNSETGNGLNKMLNKNHPIVYYSLCCETMPYFKTNGCDIDINFGESFTMGKDYGGPAYLGNTIEVPLLSVLGLANAFAKRLSNGDYVLGKVDALSKADNKNDIIHFMAINHNYLGDPSLELWTDIPQVYENITTARNDSSITISGISGESIIAYYSNDGTIGKARASSSITLNHVSPNSSFMVYKHNQIPYFIPLELQKVNLNKSQYVIASDVTAGNHIDTSRPNGNVIIPEGVEYEIEASGTVTLEDGFQVEKGATFAVYPACF